MSESRSVLVNLLFGFSPAQVLYATAQLGIADELAGGPKTLPDLARATDTDPGSLRRLLRAAAAYGVVDETGAGSYALGAHGGPMRSDSPDSIRSLIILFTGPEVWQSWGGLADSVRSGEMRWDKITGKSTFAYMADNPDYAAMFNQAMAESTRSAIPGVIEAGKFARFRTVVDVGGGDGTLLAASPPLTGVVLSVLEATPAS